MARNMGIRLVAPATVNQTVARRRPNVDYRSREHLTEPEVEALISAAKANRHGHRDATMILVAFRHGFRVAELIDLKWEQVEMEGAVLHVTRVKSGSPSTQPLTGRELRALRRMRREAKTSSPFVFVSERGSPFTTDGVAKLVARAGEVAGLGLPVTPSHAAARLWVRAGEQGHRYQDHPGMARAPQHPAHVPVYDAVG